LLRDQELSKLSEERAIATFPAKPFELRFPMGARARRKAITKLRMMSILGTEREEL
jgi:hypothetical protein